MEKLVSVTGLAELLGKSKKTLENWLLSDQYNIKSHMFKVGGTWMIDTQGFQNLMAEIKEVKS